MTKRNDDFVVKYTNKHIMDVLQELKSTGEKTLQQALKTNGRVTSLENKYEEMKKKSIGIWISNNPFKMILITVLLTIIINDSLRDPLIELIKTIW